MENKDIEKERNIESLKSFYFKDEEMKIHRLLHVFHFRR